MNHSHKNTGLSGKCRACDPYGSYDIIEHNCNKYSANKFPSPNLQTDSDKHLSCKYCGIKCCGPDKNKK